MPKQSQSRLDRELEEILTKKSKDRPKEPIQFSSHPRAPKTKGAKAIADTRELLSDLWYPLAKMPLLLAFVLAIAARLVNGVSPLLALILCAWAVGAIWWPGIKRLSAAWESDQPDVKYWRGRAYASKAKDAVSRHPVDSLKRYFDRRR